MKIYVGHSREFDFKKELYEPLRASRLNVEAEIILPHETDAYFSSKEIIQSSNFMIAEVSYHSTGLGIELGWANMFNVPIIAAHKQGSNVSSSIQHITAQVFEYSSVADLVATLEFIILKYD